MWLFATVASSPGARTNGSLMPRTPRPQMLLHIDSSAHAADSVSRALTAEVVARWRKAEPSLAVRYRDLAAEPLAHLTADMFGDTNAEDAAPAQRRERGLSDEIVEEFLAADVVVIGAPMYNFAISSQ